MYEGLQNGASRGQVIGGEEQVYMDNCKVAAQKSPIEMALDRLASMVDDAGRHSEQLYMRLQSVSQPSPANTSGGAIPSKPDSCAVEARINELATQIGRLAGGLRDMRENLCV